MKEENKFKLIGRVKLECYKKNGDLKWKTGWLYNTIANASPAVIIGLMGDVDAQTAFTYLAVGTSDAALDAAHTALQAEIVDTGLARASATVTRETTTQTNDTLQLVHTWSATGTKAIEEVGIFNASSSGVMLGRKLTTTKTVNNGEQLIGTYQVQIIIV